MIWEKMRILEKKEVTHAWQLHNQTLMQMDHNGFMLVGKILHKLGCENTVFVELAQSQLFRSLESNKFWAKYALETDPKTELGGRLFSNLKGDVPIY